MQCVSSSRKRYNDRMDTTWFDSLVNDETARGVKPDNHSFYLRQDRPAFTVVLVVHGFSANPNDGKAVANAIFEEGFCDVVGICLPGHGSTPDNLSTIKYDDWQSSVDTVYKTLREQYQQVVIYAVSMGALLALRSVVKTPPAGLVCMGTMLQAVDWRLRYGGMFGKWIITIMRHVLKRPYVSQEVLPGRESIVYNTFPIESPVELYKLMRETRPLLNRVECPTLIIHSPTDKIASPVGAQFLYDKLGTPNKALIWGAGDHTFLTEKTEENRHILAKIVRFCTSPVGYFAKS